MGADENDEPTFDYAGPYDVGATDNTWMSAKQFAQLLLLYADYRTMYLHPTLWHPGAYNDPKTRRGDQDLMLEISAFRSAARLLRNMEEAPLNLPSWYYDDWLPNVERIRHGDEPIPPHPDVYRGD